MWTNNKVKRFHYVRLIFPQSEKERQSRGGRAGAVELAQRDPARPSPTFFRVAQLCGAAIRDGICDAR